MKPRLRTLLLCGAAFVTGAIASRFFAPPTSTMPDGAATAGSAAEPTIWYCSMDPEFTLPRPGKCDICGMDLIIRPPVGVDPGPRATVVTESAMKRAEIETRRVERRYVEHVVSLNGKIDFDETQVKTITARMDGWLDRLYVDYTGIPVKKGDHLVDIYSPELLVAQQSLLAALDSYNGLANASAEERKLALGRLDSWRERLRLVGLTAEQITAIEKRRTPSDHVLILSPMSGVVVEKLANEGDHVREGRTIYRVAELSHVWATLDAYESDLPWLRYGQEVSFHADEAHPGETFHGKINFIDWVVDDASRTVKVRVNVNNTDGRLKPGMLIRADVRSTLAQSGRVMTPQLAGKWISPMHPEIVKDGPGQCDICGMDLVPAEELFEAPPADAKPPLVIPASAPLVTGRRAVVYVRREGSSPPVFEGRDVVLGPRAGDHYLVESGLEEGEQVVVRGNFKIDSALQIELKPSMMAPEGGAGPAHHHHHGGEGSSGDTIHQNHGGGAPGAEARDHHVDPAPAADDPHQATPSVESITLLRPRLSALFDAYFDVNRALADDQNDTARSRFDAVGKAVEAVTTDDLDEEAQNTWKSVADDLRSSVARGSAAADIETRRQAFHELSRAMIRVEETFGHSDAVEYHEVYCPMAFKNQGAAWLQPSKKVTNPYFGASMLRCGRVRRSFTAVPVKKDGSQSPEMNSHEGHDHE